MTTKKLKMTSKEIDKLINNLLDHDRIKETFNDIPIYHPDHVMEKGETHRNYINKGTEYRWFIFKDTLTGNEHCLNYNYNQEWPNDIMYIPDSIQIVEKAEESDLYIKPAPVEVIKEILSPEKQADQDLWNEYLAIKDTCSIVIPKEKLKVPKEKIDEILNLMKSKSFNIIQLRAVVIPVCIEYKLEEKSFWKWIQVKIGNWKA